MDKIRVGELFAGIGGIGLGLEATGGFEVVWQVENDPYAIKVLEKHWPDVRRWDDVKTFPPESGDWQVDLLAGGFPCQDISNAGKQKGLMGDRSVLFYEIIRIAEILRPGWILLENVTGLLVRGRGMGIVLSELAEIGYDAEWHSLSASASTGALHQRDRVFIIAHAQHSGSHGNWQDEQERQRQEVRRGELTRRDGRNGEVANANNSRGGASQRPADEDRSPLIQRREEQSQPEPSRQREDVADSMCDRGSARIPTEEAWRQRGAKIINDSGHRFYGRQDFNAWTTQCRLDKHPDGLSTGLDGCGGWECGIPRVVTGQPYRKERLKALGNAVVPQVAQVVGEIILDSIGKHHD